MKRTSRRPRRNPAPLDNPAFRRWFGDSKIRDFRGNGGPLVVYHGTPDGRGLYREGFRRSPTRGDSFFATDSYAMAASYADANRAWDYQNAEPGVVPLYLSIQKPLVVDWDGKVWRGTEQWVERARSEGHDGLIVHNVLDYYNDNLGRGRKKPATVFVFFSPSQAKSAATGPVPQSGIGAERGKAIQGSDRNVGTFDPSNPSILKNPAFPTALYHATPQRNLDSILQRGLLASRSSVTLSGGGVFLTDEKSLARGYAERRFGVDDYDEPWLLLKIDPVQLDPSRFEADPGQEAELNLEGIEARGYTIRTMPWWVSLEETGQMVYAGNVPPGAIEPVEIMLPSKGDSWEPVRVQRNRRSSRPKRTSRRRR